MDDAPKRGRGRPRRAGADAEILGVALSLLRDKGYRELTVDTVAERSGVAKTTIYRRWPTKAALVTAAIEPLVGDDGTRDLASLLTRLRELLSGELSPIIAELAAEGDVDFVLPRKCFREALGDRDDRELLIDMTAGALWTRLLVTRQPIPETYPQQIARTLLDQR
jgi:AcrR family transcriptional regulator